MRKKEKSGKVKWRVWLLLDVQGIGMQAGFCGDKNLNCTKIYFKENQN